MPRHNAAEAMPAPDANSEAKGAKKKKHLRVVTESDVQEAAKDAQLKDEAVALIREGYEMRTSQELDAEMNEKEQKAREIEEARKRLEEMPDMTDEAQLIDEGENLANRMVVSQKVGPQPSEEKTAVMDDAMLAAKKPKASLLSRIKGWFSKK